MTLSIEGLSNNTCVSVPPPYAAQKPVTPLIPVLYLYEDPFIHTASDNEQVYARDRGIDLFITLLDVRVCSRVSGPLVKENQVPSARWLIYC